MKTNFCFELSRDFEDFLQNLPNVKISARRAIPEFNWPVAHEDVRVAVMAPFQRNSRCTWCPSRSISDRTFDTFEFMSETWTGKALKVTGVSVCATLAAMIPNLPLKRSTMSLRRCLVRDRRFKVPYSHKTASCAQPLSPYFSHSSLFIASGHNCPIRTANVS